MSPDAASRIFVLILTTGAVVWLWSLTKALRLGLAPRQTDRWPPEEGLVFDTETGEETIRGEPATLSKDLTYALQQSMPPIMGGFFKVTERTPERIVLEKTGALMCNQPPGLYFSEAEFGLQPLGDGTVRVSYRLGYERLVRLLRRISLCLIWGVGMPIMAVIGMVLWYFVVQSNDPTIRWQVFQTFQIVHVLWPPFLVMWIYRIGRRQSKIFVGNLVATMEVLD